MTDKELTTYYHGTCSLRADLLVKKGAAFSPLYLTTNKSMAEHYGKARTAADMEVAPDVTPVLVILDLPEEAVVVDDYNLDGEPAQYKLYEPNKFLLEAFVEDVDGDWPPDETELLKLSAFCIGMGKYEEDRVTTAVGKRLGFQA